MQCASIYERLAEAIPAKYSPYSNDTLTDRRREGEIIGGLMKAKYGPFVQSSEQQRSHEPPNGEAAPTGKQEQ